MGSGYHLRVSDSDALDVLRARRADPATVPAEISPAPPRLALASASPRRRELLASLGLPFSVRVSDVTEELDPRLPPPEQALVLAARKARAIAGRGAQGFVLGADTMVVLDGEILGKPVDDDDARRMLHRLSGQPHEVVTGVVLLDAATGAARQHAVTSVVHMKPLRAAAIAAYVATGEPRDKAGAYAIQGLGGELVERFEGCFNNIVGLPLCAVAALLTDAGFAARADWPGCSHAEGE